ncbi:MAG: tetratricopeptide repeat protein [Paucimonas sp.]|jgi:tetratricopeptide (TPR) repeat protein|nr:tetratricopeptide repeat protein [Paucimonas sp.]
MKPSIQTANIPPAPSFWSQDTRLMCVAKLYCAFFDAAQIPMNNKNRMQSPSSSSGLFRTLSRIAAASGLMCALAATPAFADEAADVTKLMRSGQLADAMSRAEAFLVQKPRDAQMRFLKGLILVEQGKTTEAIAVFTKLTEDFPELPEPYNNLAVLYAANGQYEKARAALDMAIRTNPSYATAYENLGDVHAKLASQAYDKALQLDSGNSVAKSKLTLLRSIGTKGTAPVTMIAQGPKQPASSAQPARPSSPAVSTPPQTTVKIEAPRPVERPVAVNDDLKDDVLSTVQAWARAWSSQDVKGYLAFYANDFKTPKGESRKAWADERQARIAGKGRINVKIESPQVSIDGNTATVKFRQIYTSDRLKADSRKTMVLTKQGSKWLIKQERAGS